MAPPPVSLRTVRPGGDPVAVPECAALRNSPLRGVVHVDDAEPLGIAVLPFEVVEQRPDVVAADVDAGRERRLHGVEMTGDVLDAARVLHCGCAVQPVV